MLRVGRERVNCHQQIFSLCYSLAKEDSSTFTQYTTAVFKFIQRKKDKKKGKFNEKHIYNILIITKLIMGLLWPIYIISFFD